jgi:hypothetical protein
MRRLHALAEVNAQGLDEPLNAPQRRGPRKIIVEKAENLRGAGRGESPHEPGPLLPRRRIEEAKQTIGVHPLGPDLAGPTIDIMMP